MANKSFLLAAVCMTSMIASAPHALAQSTDRSDAALAELSFDQWLATFAFEGRRSYPDGPIYLEFRQRATGLDDKTLPDPLSFFRWCEAHSGTGAYTPNADIWMIEIFRTGVPYSAYGQAALRRDAHLLGLPDDRGEAAIYFKNCSDGQLQGVGTFAYVVAVRCSNSATSSWMIDCRALYYDDIAMKPLRAAVEPAFAAFVEARQKSADAEASRIAAWRKHLQPGDRSRIGLIIAVNGAVAQVQDRYGRAMWFPVDELEPDP